MGELGKLMSTFLAKAVPLVDDSAGRLILINQIRSNVGPFGGVSSPGGHGIEHWTTQRIKFEGGHAKEDGKYGGYIKNNDGQPVGKAVMATVIKNRVWHPMLETKIYLHFDNGVRVWVEREILILAVELGIIDKAGSWYSYGDQRLAQGEDGTLGFLNQNQTIFVEIKKKVYDLLGIIE